MILTIFLKVLQCQHAVVLQVAVTLLLSCAYTSAAPMKGGAQINKPHVHTSSDLLIDGLFEGDLKLSKEKIRKYYNFSSIPVAEDTIEDTQGSGSGYTTSQQLLQPDQIRDKRAAGSEDIDLWANNIIVPYEIATGIPMSTANLIGHAIDHWEDHTCLRFVVRQFSHDDYIRFDNADDGCYSDSFGRDGGRQEINLGAGCETHGIIVHEIGHLTNR